MARDRLRKSAGLLSLAVLLCLFRVSVAQAQSDQSWTSSSQQASPDGTFNPTRTSNTHTQNGNRTVDKTSVEAIGPDGRYAPYSDTETESIRVNDTTVRKVERRFGRDSDGRRVLVQETQEESRTLPGGEQKVSRTTSDPDVNGNMQIVRRELEDSKLSGPGARVTNTTVLTPDVNGGFSPAVQTEQRETRLNDGTVESRKSTLLSDGTGGWKLSEVRESTTRNDGTGARSIDERVSRPDSSGKLVLAEHTVEKQGPAESGEKRDTVETYSTNVPGIAGDGSLQLVRRETTVQKPGSAGGQSTTRIVQQPLPGDPTLNLHVTEEAIDIVRPGSNGKADKTSTILAPGSDGQLRQVWVDVGKTGNPSAVQVDTSSKSK